MPHEPQPETGIQAAPPPSMPAPITDPGPALDTAISAAAPASDTIPLPPMAPAPVEPPAFVSWTLFDLAMLALAGLLVFLLGSSPPTNHDLWQHLATGRAIVQ